MSLAGFSVAYVKRLTSWADALAVARETNGKMETGQEPSLEWRRHILLAEHSPIRSVLFRIKLVNIPSWVSVHFTRHKIGVEHYVSTQRSDRTGVPRDQLPQDAPVTHVMVANAQALINISRKRLCRNAALETRFVWQRVLARLANVDHEVASACVPECVYRGFCPEMKTCGYSWTQEFVHRVAEYRTRQLQKTIAAEQPHD